MYLFLGIFLFLCIFFFLFNYRRKKRIIQKVRCMNSCEKLTLINELMEPYGYSYLPEQNIITTRLDAWQREFGYRFLFDQMADRFNMVFDCEPIYFDYDGRTWLIEFWKGQYGINIGCEVGIYYADSVLTPQQYKTASFQSVPNNRMPVISVELYHNRQRLFSFRRTHWWLAGFFMGYYCNPDDLVMQISITFPNSYMLQRFTTSLITAGYDYCSICACGHTVSITFDKPFYPQPRSSFYSRIAQWKNRQLCRLFQRITRPFSQVPDKLLYLYYFLPYTFRRTLRLRKNKYPKCSR